MIRNRNDLVEYLENFAPQPCIKRSVSEGHVENYGLFSRPLDATPVIIVKVTSKHKKVWYVAILIHYLIDKPRPRVIGNVCWGCWIGDSPPATPLMMGDHPEKYKELRDDYKK